MKVTVKTEGFKELEEALQELPKATAKNVLRRAMAKAAQPMIDEAIALAPARPGSGRLKQSIVAAKIRFSSAKAEAFKAEFAAAMREGATRADAGARGKIAAGEAPQGQTSATLIWGVLKSAFYGYFLEYGTAKLSPRPFMRPAWQRHKMQALQIIQDVTWLEISKAANRLARKTAKLKT